MGGITSCVFHGVFALPVPAQVLAVAWRSVTDVAVFSPIPRFSR